MTSHRRERVNAMLREELSLVLSGDLGDPRLALVSVSDVEVSSDLRNVRVYVSVFDDDPAVERDALRALTHAHGYLRRRLAQQVNLRFTPELSFHLDRTEARAQRIDRLLNEIGSAPAAGDGSPAPSDREPTQDVTP